MDEILFAAGSGAVHLFGWPVFPMLVIGTVTGMVFGLVPGLSGLTGLALLFPIAIGQPPEIAVALLLGLYASGTQTDTIPAVLLGVPGSSAAAATTLDGYPMSKKGEAGRALSASYAANIVGTIISCFIFIAALPLLRELISALASPEFFMLAVLGLVLAGSLSGDSVAKGLMMACGGLLVSMIGLSPNTGEPRLTMGTFYLWEGVPIVAVLLGLFGVPEVIELAAKNSTIASTAVVKTNGFVRGLRDVAEHWWLVVKTSVAGAACGFIPGLGGPVAEWFGYAIAVNSAKDPSTFGKGDIRGVIAPEAATAAQKPGALIPTICFGIPGNASMAMLLGVFMIVGLIPGPDMVTTKLDITFLMFWTIVAANIIAALLSLALQRYLILICFIRATILVPILLAFMVMGAALATKNFGDVVVFGVFGALGCLFKYTNWPRVPMTLGLILGPLAEPYFFLSVDRYGIAWLWERPVVATVFALIVAAIVIPIYQNVARRRRDRSALVVKTTHLGGTR